MDAIQYEVKCLMVNAGYRNIGNVRRRRSLANVLPCRIVPPSPVEELPAKCNPGTIYLSGFDLAVPTSIGLPYLQSLVLGGAEYTYSEC